MQDPEKIWHFTTTGWTAIGSIVSAVSIFVLSIFNFFYLKAAKKAADAANQQATAAKDTLIALKKQSEDEQLQRKVAAFDALKGLARNARTRLALMHAKDPGNDFTLLPGNWADFMLYTGLHHAYLDEQIRLIENEARNVEKKVIAYLSSPYNSRSTVTPNSTELEGSLNLIAEQSDYVLKLLNEPKAK